jgi:diguanylate cyclase (GGDEF)-like protein
MAPMSHERDARLRLRVGGKFLLTIGVLVPAVLTIAGVGGLGLQRMSQRTDELYGRGLAVSQHTAAVVSATLTIHETALFQVAVSDPRRNDQLTNELDFLLIPDEQRAIALLRADYLGRPQQLGQVDDITAKLQTYLDLRATGVYEDDQAHPADAAARTALAQRTDDLLEPIADEAKQLGDDGVLDSAAVEAQSDRTYTQTRLVLVAAALTVLLIGLGIVLALIRNVVPRIRQYSQFASDIASGRPTTPLEPRGSDELAELGVALNHMVDRRDRATRREQEQREQEIRAGRSRTEFVDTLQVTRNEQEAQQLLQRHLQRTLPDTAVAVLRQNNSANRLESATPLPQDDKLPEQLVGAQPASCVAIRLGRAHHDGTGRSPLLNCGLCEHRGTSVTCEPLLVGGEVIGAVLVSSDEDLDDAAEAQVRDTVTQAAPVLANLRSLALAEFRANNDSLTGLPNKRATEDTVKQMVAQAVRAGTPLSAVMLDLDHFKQINDRYGHALGDEVLAAVGAVLAASLRSGDFAGRLGGEEFLVLLPETSIEVAAGVGERIRQAVATITVPGLDRSVTASLGIAALHEHADNAVGLLRAADKAQYAAKAAGRDRLVVAEVGAATGRAGAGAASGPAAALPQPATSAETLATRGT